MASLFAWAVAHTDDATDNEQKYMVHSKYKCPNTTEQNINSRDCPIRLHIFDRAQGKPFVN